MGVADLAPGLAGAFASGLMRALDESSVGAEVLDALEAIDGSDLVEDDEGEGFSDTWHGAQDAESLGVVVLGGS